MINNRTLYFSVGLVSILLFVTALVLTVSFSKKSDLSYLDYVIYFDSSVSGLKVGSPIRLKGIEVGKVKAIGFKSFTSDTVEVMADIVDTAPILQSTVATIKMLGLSDTSYIELKTTESGSSALVKESHQKHLTIPSIGSRADRIFEQLPDMFANLSSLGQALNNVLDEESVASLKRSILNLEEFTENLSTNMPGEPLPEP